MEQLLWNAARRLALLVGCALSILGALLVHDALTRHGAAVANLSAAAAASLAVTALVALIRANRLFARPEDSPTLRGDPYRHNARAAVGEAFDSGRVRATRSAAGALLALSVAVAFVVVAAASR